MYVVWFKLYENERRHGNNEDLPIAGDKEMALPC